MSVTDKQRSVLEMMKDGAIATQDSGFRNHAFVRVKKPDTDDPPREVSYNIVRALAAGGFLRVINQSRPRKWEITEAGIEAAAP